MEKYKSIITNIQSCIVQRFKIYLFINLFCEKIIECTVRYIFVLSLNLTHRITEHKKKSLSTACFEKSHFLKTKARGLQSGCDKYT